LRLLEKHDPARSSDADRTVLQYGWLCNLPDQGGGPALNEIRRVRMLKNNGELITPEARDQGSTLLAISESFCDDPEQIVTRCMTKRVVHGLKVV
jgi:hypothetical protein